MALLLHGASTLSRNLLTRARPSTCKPSSQSRDRGNFQLTSSAVLTPLCVAIRNRCHCRRNSPRSGNQRSNSQRRMHTGIKRWSGLRHIRLALSNSSERSGASGKARTFKICSNPSQLLLSQQCARLSSSLAALKTNTTRARGRHSIWAR